MIAWWTIATGIMTLCSLFEVGWSTATEPRLPADLIETVSKHNTSATPAALMSYRDHKCIVVCVDEA